MIRFGEMHSRSEFEDILGSFGLDYRLNWPWLSVGRTTRMQGWKLHVSSVPVQLADLLRTILPLLQDEAVPFKIAQDLNVCALLNEGAFGPTQVGKCVTVYPADDLQAVRIARKLCQAARGFRGPSILSDVKLGNVVYTRRGSFSPKIIRDVLGQMHTLIDDGAGNFVPDIYRHPSTLLGLSDYPFSSDEFENSIPKFWPTERILGPGYLVLDTYDSDLKGATLQALDTRSDRVEPRLIKQARAGHLSDLYGRDSRDRLQHQATMLARCAHTGVVPKCDPYFSIGDDGYLPMEYIFGASLEKFVTELLDQRTIAFADDEARQRLLAVCVRIVEAVEAIHREGVVHRDLSASNILVDDHDGVWLIDLESAQLALDPDPPFGKGTPGFMAPEQLLGAAPEFSQDVHAVGAAVFFSLTGIDPRRLFPPHSERSLSSISKLLPGLPDQFLAMLHSCLDADPGKRPSLAALRTLLGSSRASVLVRPESGVRRFRRKDPIEDVEAALEAGVVGLEQVAARTAEGLWLSCPILGGQVDERAMHPLELHRSLNRGAAGVLYLLSQLCGEVTISPSLTKSAFSLAQWLLQERSGPDAGLAGLHFGEAGVALAIVRALAKQLIPGGLADTAHRTGAFRLARQGDWPDVTHGAAGQGLAAMFCERQLDPDGEVAKECAEYLMEVQNQDGSWTMPDGVEGMSGQILSGFAHGVSGIGYFLAEYGNRRGCSAALIASAKSAAWLLQQRSVDRSGRSSWPYSNTMPTHWNWWCHGGPGISILFRTLHVITGEPNYREAALSCVHFENGELLTSNLSLCHGLSGLGMIWLETALALNDERSWVLATAAIEKILALQHHTKNSAAFWIVEDPNRVTADLMVGMGSVLLFLSAFQAAKKGGRVSFPGELEALRRP